MGLKQTDLRVGNFVLDNLGGILKINGISSNSDLSHIKPIKLTEEWLLKFGFDKNKSLIIDSYSKSISKHSTLKLLNVTIQQGNEYIAIREGENEKPSTVDIVTVLLNGDTHGRPFYVHQLQNLYHALTGQELTIKQT